VPVEVVAALIGRARVCGRTLLRRFDGALGAIDRRARRELLRVRRSGSLSFLPRLPPLLGSCFAPSDGPPQRDGRAVPDFRTE